MKIRQIFLVAILALAAALSVFLGIFGDWFWFVSVGYDAVFLNILFTSLGIGLVSFVAFFAFSCVNILVAKKAALGKKKHSSKQESRIMLGFAALASLIAAVAMGGSWETVLKYLNYSSFSASDPVFGLNIGFYVFTLPFYSLALNFILGLLAFSGIIAVVTYVIHSSGFKVVRETQESPENGVLFGGFEGNQMAFKWSGSWKRFMPHLSTLLFLAFLAVSAGTWLARYSVLFSPSGAAFGAGFTDISVTLPLLSIISVVSVLVGLIFLANIKLKKPEVIKIGLVIFAVVAFLGIVAGGVVQFLVVEPDEFNLEKPYLERNIQSTLAAYGLDAIQERMFPVNQTLTKSDIEKNSATIDNIRLWDWRPLKKTYNQLQLFRTYYNFNDVDVDRYRIDSTYKQVLVSAREMNTRELPSQAQTWVNKHLVYTHGYGVVMNPVDRVSSEGLPEFYIKDIPPVSQHIELEQMRIYFGESTGDYAITGTSTEEFDYPSGDENIYTSYSGSGGVPLDGLLTKLAYALRFGSVEILISGSLTPESKLLMNRNIKERVSSIAPFLEYDSDPYIVVSDGRLFWMVDAYTITGMYPYSEPLFSGWNALNYVRNPVKVVVDAYNGDVTYYIVDQSDPIIQTYQKMFPGLFLDSSEMPEDIKSHIRYPEDIFTIQAAIYSTYHMKDPMVFYNKEDVWVTPDEIYRGSRERMQPYYIIMKPPGEENEEFILMLPFTPRGKENLIGWMAARSDSSNYGKMFVYQFSKQELTYGPMQIEARIDQDTDISQLITLWSQSGSGVLRGNTLVIPVENSIMYVEPLYLEATERGTLPQLQRVIVAYGGRLTMQETLSKALDVIFGQSDTTVPSSGDTPVPIPETEMEKLSRIAELYGLAQEALTAGDLGLYQQYFRQIGELVSG